LSRLETKIGHMTNHKIVHLPDVPVSRLCYTVTKVDRVGIGMILGLLDRVCEMENEVDGKIMRVLIADDEPRVRSALRLLLRYYPGVAVAGEADNVERALELVARHRPDLLLLDWELLGRNSATVLERLRASRQGLAVIALSGRPEARRAALAAGVDAFVSKGDPPERLLATLQTVLRIAPRRSGTRIRPSGTTVPVYNL